MSGGDISTAGYIAEEWDVPTWNVYLCDMKGQILEQLIDVDFDSQTTLNEIPSATVTVTGRKPGYFRPWQHSIAITRNSVWEPFFFGPIISTRTKVVSAPEYSATTEINCEGWEAWLERTFPSVVFSSYGDKTAFDAVTAIWSGGEQADAGLWYRMLKFQQAPPINLPGTIKFQIPAWVEWEYLDGTPGGPSAWSLHQELHSQGVDVGLRPTPVAGGFTSRYVIGGSSNSDPVMGANPKTGRFLDTELVVGNDVADLTYEERGDQQANAILVTGADELVGIAPVQTDADWFAGTVPAGTFAGLLLELQATTESSIERDDPEQMLRQIAFRYRKRFNRPPVYLSEMKVRIPATQLRCGDLITVTDNGGAQIIDPRDGTTVQTKWGVQGRVASISISSSDVMFSDVTLFEARGEGELQDNFIAGLPLAEQLYWYSDLSQISNWVARLAAKG